MGQGVFISSLRSVPIHQERQPLPPHHLEDRHGGRGDEGGEVENPEYDRGLECFKFGSLQGRNLIIQEVWSASGLPRSLSLPKGEEGLPGRRGRQGQRGWEEDSQISLQAVFVPLCTIFAFLLPPSQRAPDTSVHSPGPTGYPVAQPPGLSGAASYMPGP